MFNYICPLSKKLIVDGVIDIEGNIYERKYINEYIERYHEIPSSKYPISLCDLQELKIDINDIIKYSKINECSENIIYLNCTSNGKFKSSYLSYVANINKYEIIELQFYIIKWYKYLIDYLKWLGKLMNIKKENYQYNIIFNNLELIVETITQELIKITFDYSQIKKSIFKKYVNNKEISNDYIIKFNYYQKYNDTPIFNNLSRLKRKRQ